MSDKLPYSLFRIPISFVPSKPLKTVADDHSISKEEVKEKLGNSITKFYQSVISLPPTKKKKVRKSKMKTCKKQQGEIINKKSIANNSAIEDCFSQLNFVSTDNEGFFNSLAKSIEDSDKDKDVKPSEKKNVEPIKDTTKIVKSNESFSGKDDNKIWCIDCGIWLEKHLYKDHIHGTAHLISKNLDDQTIPDPLKLNETNIGFRMLRDQGWRYEKGLGVNEQGRRHPIPTRLKNDRLGIGASKRPPKMKLKRLNAKQTATQYEQDRRDRIRLLAYMNR
ncbi:hypothetical protein C1645_877675 [Glomus cerebriforme]|uniref:G-patch domain-containing protein n=1 Tax=Glomus cerebriforme TaxID=658196 RepID=A0A397SPV4_9GLOM|nr:hypothetical protein C1645_877675 [Glomus cerebriforme]